MRIGKVLSLPDASWPTTSPAIFPGWRLTLARRTRRRSIDAMRRGADIDIYQSSIAAVAVAADDENRLVSRILPPAFPASAGKMRRGNQIE